MSLIHPTKHSYLQQALCYGINQKMINTIVDKAVRAKSRKSDAEVAFQDVPAAKLETVHGGRQAFGRWALPKLKRELHYPDLVIVMHALNTIGDLIHDPEKAFEAIRIRLVDRLIDLLVHESGFIREKTCVILYTLAGQAIGRQAIIKRYQMLTNLSRLLEDESDKVKYKAQLLVERLSQSCVGAEGLNSADYVVLMIRLIGGSPRTENEDVVVVHLSTLEMLLYGDAKLTALQHNAMDVLLEKAEHPREEICATALACIALLCWHPAGRREADDKRVLDALSEKLFDERKKVHTKAAGAVAFATLTTEGKLYGVFLNLTDRLLDLLQDFHTPELQLMSAKALTNLAEEPAGRSRLVGQQNRIQSVYTDGNADVERHIETLLSVVRWRP